MKFDQKAAFTAAVVFVGLRLLEEGAANYGYDWRDMLPAPGGAL